MRKLVEVPVLALVLIAACGGGSSGDDADDVFLALDAAMFPAIIQAQSANQGDGQHSVDLQVACDSGTLTLAGTLERSTGRTLTDYTVTLASCTNSGITMTGSITYHHDARSDAPSPKSYDGTLQLMDAGFDSCLLDFDISASTDTPCQLSYAGTICGVSGRQPLGTTCPSL